MGAPTSLLGQARAFARDFPRDEMPRGYLWDVVDYVPTLLDASLTGRGAWYWASEVMSDDPVNGLLAPFSGGDKLLVIDRAGSLWEVAQSAPYTNASRGSGLPVSAQNPVQLHDTVVQLDESGAQVPRLLNVVAGIVTASASPAAASKARRATVYKSMLVTAAALNELSVVRFTVPGKPLSDPTAYDANSFISSSLEVTGLAALRTTLIVFHRGSTERIRGNTPPQTPPAGATDLSTYIGDMFLEPLFDHDGCTDPKTIAYWKDNVIFANEHGVHMTDGAVVSNLASQGGILGYWRPTWENHQSMAAGMFLDYYMLTVITQGGFPITLICDLPRKQWFRFSNIAALTYITSSGASGMERLWAGMQGTKRLSRLGPTFFPAFGTGPMIDDNGTPVLPTFETPWYRLAQEGRKRVRFVYLSYDARLANLTTPVLDIGYATTPQQPAYVDAGKLPATDEYTRYRLPVGKFPYGLAFKVAQTEATNVLRVFDLGIEAWAGERSRI